MPRINQDLSSVKEEEMNRDRGVWEVKPDGWYRAVYQASTYKPTQSGNGMVLVLEGVFLDPPHTDDKLFDSLTLEHPNPKTTQISRIRLKELAIATGHPTPDYVSKSEDLEGKAFMVRLYSQRTSDPKYGDINGMQQRIGEYKSRAAWEADQAEEATNARVTSSSQSGEPPPWTDEEIPF